ncbi:MAG: hypothetical protein V4440_02395 [Pseudomonadota bacterium]
MTDISETQTFEYFLHGVKKAKSAARELSSLNSSNSWTKIRSVLGQIERNGTKLYNAKPQTELANLILADSIEKNSVN